MGNTNKKTTGKNPVLSKREEDIGLILKLLENWLDELKQDVSVSKALLPEGIKTNLVNDIEKSIDNPYTLLFSLRAKLDGDLKEISADIIKLLLNYKNDLISAAYRTENFEAEAVYCIVLKDDSFENRETVLQLLDIYEAIIQNNACLVNFQFVPENLADVLTYIEKIPLKT